MGLQATLGVVTDATFQGRCVVALRECAANVLNDVSGYPEASNMAAADPADDDAYARIVMKGEQRVPLEVLATNVMQNSTVAGAPTTDNSTIDDAIRWEINNKMWKMLREIG